MRSTDSVLGGFPWRVRLWVGLVLVGLIAGSVASAASEEALREATVVIFNNRDARSQTLAEFYRKAREIPEENVIGLATAIAETITRKQYNEEIAVPLRRELIARGFWDADSATRGAVRGTKVRFCVLMRGIPVRIQRDATIQDAPAGLQEPFKPRNEAAVDSELAALGLGVHPLCGPINNPYFKSYLPILDHAMPAGFLVVARLDAPLGSEAERMVTDSIEVEANGLWGSAYLDTRGLKSGQYRQGDQWILDAGASLRKAGVPVFLDGREARFPKAFMPDDVAWYLGWYTANADGPFREERFRFVPGAIAVHIHSFSGETVRNPGKRWVGPLIARGAAATLGNVFEPYLELTPHLDIFTDRLLKGYTFGEAAYMSLRAISWQTTLVGDPLYRPYRTWADVVAGFGLESNPYLEYRDLLRKSGPTSVKVGGQIRALANRVNLPELTGGAADLAFELGDADGAIDDLNEAMAKAGSPDQKFAFFYRKVMLQLRAGRKAEAIGTLQGGLKAFSEPQHVNFIADLLDQLQKKP